MKSGLKILAAAVLLVGCDKSGEVTPPSAKVQLDEAGKEAQPGEPGRKPDVEALVKEARQLLETRYELASLRGSLMEQSGTGTLTDQRKTGLKQRGKALDAYCSRTTQSRAHLDSEAKEIHNDPRLSLLLVQDDHMIKIDEFRSELIRLSTGNQWNTTDGMRLRDELTRKVQDELDELERLRGEYGRQYLYTCPN